MEAFQSNVIFPNRHVESHNSMYDGHLLESETYVGGHVEALEAGVFRSDIETDFKIVPSAIQGVRYSLALSFDDSCETPAHGPSAHSSSTISTTL